jgi:hypothetical protein
LLLSQKEEVNGNKLSTMILWPQITFFINLSINLYIINY